MKTYLLDVNLLLALSWPSHEFHQDAQTWFKHQSRNKWATCPITQAGFVRLSCNPVVIRNAVTAKEALRVLNSNLKHPRHVFWPDMISMEAALDSLHTDLLGHRQVTDAYLWGLAIHNKGVLATFDTRIRSLAPDHSPTLDSLLVIPVSN